VLVVLEYLTATMLGLVLQTALLAASASSSSGALEATALARAQARLPLPPDFAASEVLFFDLNATVAAQGLDYSEQLLAFVFQGTVNDASLGAPALQLNAAFMNFGMWWLW